MRLLLIAKIMWQQLLVWLNLTLNGLLGYLVVIVIVPKQKCLCVFKLLKPLVFAAVKWDSQELGDNASLLANAPLTLLNILTLTTFDSAKKEMFFVDIFLS